MRRSKLLLLAVPFILGTTEIATPAPALAGSALTTVAAGPGGGEQRDCRRRGNGRRVGAILGAVGGAILGNVIDGGRNRGTGTILGGIVGSLIGSEIGDALDRCEQQKLQAATLEAANSNGTGQRSRSEWRSDSRPDTWGTVTAGNRVARRDGRECRTITRVSYIEGEERHGSSEVCRRPPDTAWA